MTKYTVIWEARIKSHEHPTRCTALSQLMSLQAPRNIESCLEINKQKQTTKLKFVQAETVVLNLLFVSL